jgi:CRP/FNR family cyclic AMP-dependent transcriptional regulator
VHQPGTGEFFGFASMIDQTPRQTSALTLEETACLEVERNDIMVLLHRKSLAGMDRLAALGRQIHAAQHLVRSRSARNPNEVIEEQANFGNHVADAVARFGGSWSFILCCLWVPDGIPVHQRRFGALGLGPLSLHPAQPVSLPCSPRFRRRSS